MRESPGSIYENSLIPRGTFRTLLLAVLLGQGVGYATSGTDFERAADCFALAAGAEPLAELTNTCAVDGEPALDSLRNKTIDAMRETLEDTF
ncbi:hypothetical protein JKY72_02115 [Candidatus Gracilibacteria bacterium]|nr:hypothetical protein [Candidatus Gracilibacteria bacterium]